MPNVLIDQEVTITPADQETIWGVGLWTVYRTVDSVEEVDPIALVTVTPTVVAGTDPEAEEDLNYEFSWTVTPGSGQSAGKVVSYRFVPAGTEIDKIGLIWTSGDYTIVKRSVSTLTSSNLSVAVWVGV